MDITSGNIMTASDVNDEIAAYVTKQLASNGEIATTIDSKIEAAIGSAIGGSY